MAASSSESGLLFVPEPQPFVASPDMGVCEGVVCPRCSLPTGPAWVCHSCRRHCGSLPRCIRCGAKRFPKHKHAPTTDTKGDTVAPAGSTSATTAAATATATDGSSTSTVTAVFIACDSRGAAAVPCEAAVSVQHLMTLRAHGTGAPAPPGEFAPTALLVPLLTQQELGTPASTLLSNSVVSEIMDRGPTDVRRKWINNVGPVVVLAPVGNTSFTLSNLQTLLPAAAGDAGAGAGTAAAAAAAAAATATGGAGAGAGAAASATSTATSTAGTSGPAPSAEVAARAITAAAIGLHNGDHTEQLPPPPVPKPAGAVCTCAPRFGCVDPPALRGITPKRTPSNNKRIVVVVGTVNPQKVGSVTLAFNKLGLPLSRVVVSGVNVESGVPGQPVSHKETYTGAKNRLAAARTLCKEKGVPASIFVAIENGIVEGDDEWFDVAVVAAGDAAGHRVMAPSMGIHVPYNGDMDAYHKYYYSQKTYDTAAHHTGGAVTRHQTMIPAIVTALSILMNRHPESFQ